MKKLTAAVFLQLAMLGAYGQNWIGYANSNYAGTNGLYLNPSTIVDSRHGAYINFFGNGTNVYNNYISFSGDRSLLKYLRDTSLKITDANIRENLNGKDKVVNFSNELRGPSFLVSVHPRHAFALSVRNRTYVQAVDISQPIARMIRWGTDPNSPPFQGDGELAYDELYRQTRFNVNVNSFVEAGFTYAAVVYNRDQHFVKAGITYKYLAGLYTFYFKNDGGSGISINGQDSLTFDNTNISYGYVNEALYTNSGSTDMSLLFGRNRIGKGYGLDLGVTYEWRPNYSSYKFEMDGEQRTDKEENKYKLRFGATLMDVGRIRYSNTQYVQNNVVAKNKVVHWGSLDTAGKIFENMDSVPEGQSVFYRFDEAVSKVFGFDGRTNEIVSKLPTALNIQVDYKIRDHIYVNLMWLQGLRKKGTTGIRQFSMLALTPRFEGKWFEASLPIVLNNDYRNLTLGAMLRFGPFFVGSDNISGLLKSKNVNGFDVYAGCYLPIFKRNPRDRDRDLISDRRDRCKQVAGTTEFYGCPDTDKDGIEDKNDGCPTVAGVAHFQGCPDTDNDSIQDKFDECPTVAGSGMFGGCPDTDNDGIEDRKDSCVFLAGDSVLYGCPDTDHDGIADKDDECVTQDGKREHGGCPDADKDGIRDKDDKCPEVAGEPQYAGCPDTDMDGWPDSEDKCPTIAGLPEYAGCPDTDKDSLPDNTDQCPTEAGPLSNGGCPLGQMQLVELNEEEKKVLNEVFANLEFETAKSIIRKESYPSLDELAELMKAKPEYRLYIAGHTDNVGKKQANLKLSQDRAKAVKTYLISKGIEASRIKTEGFGDSKPLDSNKTEEGRQRNRRVEFKVIK